MDLLPIIDALAPQALPVVRQAFAVAWVVLDRWRITSRLRIAHWLAQVLYECQLGTRLQEGLRYTTAGRLRQVWPSRFPTEASALPYLRDPEALANFVYGGRMGNVLPGDGWRYHGRGLIQLTGRSAYRQIGGMVGVDIETDPEMVLSEHLLVPCAAAFWAWKGINAYADSDDLRGVTRLVNGGRHGLHEREELLLRAKGFLGV